jgi:pathogenesis-related protein 1
MTIARRRLALPLAALVGSLLVEGCGPLDKTTDVPAGGPPPPGFGTDMLDAQNAVRADPSTVDGSPAPSPALAPLAWSDTVAARAQAYADGCVYAHDVNALRALGYGENLAAAAPPGSLTTAQVVGLWASEAPYYHYDTNTCDAANAANTAHTCGHYTQLVWRGTTVVGCGVQACTRNSPFQGFSTWQLWVCDYAPPGNYVGERPY